MHTYIYYLTLFLNHLRANCRHEAATFLENKNNPPHTPVVCFPHKDTVQQCQCSQQLGCHRPVLRTHASSQHCPFLPVTQNPVETLCHTLGRACRPSIPLDILPSLPVFHDLYKYSSSVLAAVPQPVFTWLPRDQTLATRFQPGFHRSGAVAPRVTGSGLCHHQDVQHLAQSVPARFLHIKASFSPL